MTRALHQFTDHSAGVINADNCQICGRWFDEPETAVCKDNLADTDECERCHDIRRQKRDRSTVKIILVVVAAAVWGWAAYNMWDYLADVDRQIAQAERV